MKREHTDLNDDEDILALLREVGGGDEPSAKAAEEVRQAVHQEWRATVAQRKRRNRGLTFGIAASFALAMVVASWALRYSDGQSELSVTIARIDGAARIQSSPADPVRTINVGEGLSVGGVLMTDDATRIALAYGTGISMRIDRGSKIHRVSPDRFRLTAGAVYIDAQQAPWRYASKCTFGILDVGEDCYAPLVVGLAVQCRADVPRRALQKSYP